MVNLSLSMVAGLCMMKLVQSMMIWSTICKWDTILF